MRSSWNSCYFSDVLDRRRSSCDNFFNMYKVCRLTTYSFLLYLCLERLLAVYPNKKSPFQKFRSQNGRILYLIVSLLLAWMIYIPIAALRIRGTSGPNLKGGCKSLSYSTVSTFIRFFCNLWRDYPVSIAF